GLGRFYKSVEIRQYFRAIEITIAFFNTPLPKSFIMSANKHKLTIAVTALNAIDSPGPGVEVIRALREGLGADIRIIGLSYETLEPGIYMRDV
ncbi:hypothetical protein ABTD73_19160, partial [Acinetobacter baumannii]